MANQKNDKTKDLADLVAGIASFEKVGEPCIDSDTLIRYALGQLPEDANKHVRAHLLYCDECAKEVVILWQLREEEPLPAADVERGKVLESLRKLDKSGGPVAAHPLGKKRRGRALKESPETPGPEKT